MKKYITAIVAAMMFTSTVAVANTTDAINQYQSTNTDSVALKPVEKEDNGTEEARKTFVKLTEEVVENAKMVRFLGAHWSVAHTESQRLLLLKQKAEAKSKSYEQRIGKIVEEQQELGQGRVVETGRRVPQSIGDFFREWQFTFRIVFGARVLR